MESDSIRETLRAAGHILRARKTITPCFAAPIHPAWLGCENLKDNGYSCVSARCAGMHECRSRHDAGCDPCQTGTSTPKIQELIVSQALSPRADRSADLEAGVLLCHLLKKPRSYLYAWPERTLQADTTRRYDALVKRRALGEPLAYITGHREFWSLDFVVSPATLIPRPETEQLVELALQHITGGETRNIADLGTGCGAIGLAIASERPDIQVTVTDESAEALQVTQQNITRFGLSNVDVREGAWCNPLPGDTGFAVIVSNPPYVAADDPHLQRGDPAWEPPLALNGGADGLESIRMLARQTPGHLEENGWLLLEHGWTQGAEVREILRQAGFRQLRTHRDISGLERITEGCRVGPPAPIDRINP